MSNEMKDWIYDMICDTVLDLGTMDRIEEVYPASFFMHNYVRGQKNGQPVLVEVWFEDETGKWKVEHRELAK